MMSGAHRPRAARLSAEQFSAGSLVNWSSQDVQLARDACRLELMLMRTRLAARDRAITEHALSELYADPVRRWRDKPSAGTAAVVLPEGPSRNGQ